MEDGQISKTRNPDRPSERQVTLSHLELSEGKNTIQIVLSNNDGRAVNPPKTDIEMPPPPPGTVPLVPEITFTNANSQVPLANMWRGDNFELKYTIHSKTPLLRLALYLNGQRLESPKITVPDNEGNYSFTQPLTLLESQNSFRVRVIDRKVQIGERSVNLGLTAQGKGMAITDLFVPETKQTLVPNKQNPHLLTFNEAAGHSDRLFEAEYSWMAKRIGRN